MGPPAERCLAGSQPVGASLNGTDFIEGGLTLKEAGQFALELRKYGGGLITVSGGGRRSSQADRAQNPATTSRMYAVSL